MKCSQCKEEGHSKRTCPAVGSYTVSLELSAGNKYTAKGKTIDEALNNLQLSYLDIKSKGWFTLTKGTKKATKLFYCRPLRRIVVNKLRKTQVGRDLAHLLK